MLARWFIGAVLAILTLGVVILATVQGLGMGSVYLGTLTAGCVLFGFARMPE